MNRTFVAGALVSVTGVVAVVGVAAGRGPSAPSHGVNVTIGADRMALVTGADGIRRLEVTRYASGAEVTGVSPSHDRLRVPTAVWARGWKRLYGTSEPNAVIAYGRGANVRRLSVSLASLSYNPAKRTMTFPIRPMAAGVMTRPPLATEASRAQAGTRQELGAGQLYVDQTADFGSNSQAQDQSAVNALLQAGMGTTITTQDYLCCNSGMQSPDIENGLPAGEAYDSLMLQPGTVATISFTGAPAFGSTSLTGLANITFANGEDNDGATFGLSGAGAFKVASGSLLNFGTVPPGTFQGIGGTENVVIYNGDFSGGTLTGRLGSNSALIGGSMDGTQLQSVQFNDALLAGVSFEGATFKSAGGLTSFNDSALVGVNFEGATLYDVLNFNGTPLVSLSTPSPDGEPINTPTSFKNVNGGGQSLVFGPSLNDPAAQVPIDGVSFAGLTNFESIGIGSAVITNSDFTNADLSGMTPLTMSNTSIDNASNFTGTNFGTRPDFKSCTFNGTDLTNVKWVNPQFGLADVQEGAPPAPPTVLRNVTFNPETWVANENNGLYSVTFADTVFDGTTIVGLDPADAYDVQFISDILNSPGVTTSGLGLIVFNTQYVLGTDGDGTPTWYTVNGSGTQWTPIDSVSLQPTGPPTNVDPTVPPEPDPAPPAPGPEAP